MKKFLVLVIFFIGISTVSYSQVGKESSSKRGNFLSRLFHRADKPRAQMQHFDKRPIDPKLKHNGTAFWRSRKRQYNTTGDGFSIPSTGNGKEGKRAE